MMASSWPVSSSSRSMRLNIMRYDAPPTRCTGLAIRLFVQFELPLGRHGADSLVVTLNNAVILLRGVGSVPA